MSFKWQHTVFPDIARACACALAICALSVVFTGCQRDDGEGSLESVGEQTEEAAEEMSDTAEDVVEETKESTEELVDEMQE